jgi:hypothetical protein
VVYDHPKAVRTIIIAVSIFDISPSFAFCFPFALLNLCTFILISLQLTIQAWGELRLTATAGGSQDLIHPLEHDWMVRCVYLEYMLDILGRPC